MPIYEYRCSSCGHQQESLQKVSDPLLTVCSACGKATLSKMLTAAGFQLKGSGWYATDFRNQGAGKAKSADAKGEAKPAVDGKSEAKPAVDGKSEAKPAVDGKSEARPAASPDSKGDKTGT